VSNQFNEKLKHAREVFAIKDFPGDLFSFISNKENFINEYKLVLFKEDLDKLGGFIAYEDDFAYIGVNHKRPICYQNFTLAHELGHWFLHKGKCFSEDNSIEIEPKILEEKEAYQFGKELLYPEALFLVDNEHIMRESLLNPSRAERLGLYIDELCHKYFLSFQVILRRVLYKNYKIHHYKLYLEAINDALGMKYTKLDTNFHIALNSTFDKPSNTPYIYLRKLVNEAIENQVISPATGEAVLFPYNNREGE
jgi:Zn-dependent peptidase ImmA (M78 family)